jgi:HSP20 family protein
MGTSRDPLGWDFSKELDEIRDRFERIFGSLPAQRSAAPVRKVPAAWVPLVDVTEDEKEYLIKAEVPEVNRKDIRVTVQHGVLTIQGERTGDLEERDKQFRRVERSYGAFVRCFTLPEDILQDNLRAELTNGMLLIRLPKGGKPKLKATESNVA